MKAEALNDKTPQHGRGEHGFSLVEMLIAMVIFMVITGAIWGLLRVGQLNNTAINNEVQVTRAMRLGLNLVGRDTFNAGFGYPLRNTVVLKDNAIGAALGIPQDGDVLRDTVPPIIAGNNITLNTYNETAGVRTDQVTFLFKDSTFNVVPGIGGVPVSQTLNINAATTTSGIDEIVPITGSNANCRKNDLYLISGNTGSTLGLATELNGTDKVQFSNGDVLGFNQAGVGGTIRGITTPASMVRVRMITFFVTADGILTRREFVNAPPAPGDPPVPFVDEPLVYGVEDFQIKYVMENGTVLDNPMAGPDGTIGTPDDDQGLLALIREVRYTIHVRTLSPDQTGQSLRTNMTSTFSTKNLGYDAN